MSTRAVWGFVCNGQEKLTYNHWDGYPEGLGQELLTMLKKTFDSVSYEEGLSRCKLEFIKTEDGEAGDEMKTGTWCEYAYIINLDAEMYEFYYCNPKTPENLSRYDHQLVSSYPLKEFILFDSHPDP